MGRRNAGKAGAAFVAAKEFACGGEGGGENRRKKDTGTGAEPALFDGIA